MVRKGQLPFQLFFSVAGGVAPAGATKGLSGRPVETFGCILFWISVAEAGQPPFLQFFSVAGGFAPAGATKGLSGRPLETFGCILFWNSVAEEGQPPFLQFFSVAGVSRLRTRPRAFRSPFGNLRGHIFLFRIL